MVNLKIITIGSLKENYLRDAVAEYEKRLSGFCKITNINLKEAKLPQNPSEGEIAYALSEEGKAVLCTVTDRAYKIALCIEGRQFSSAELSEKLDTALLNHNELCFIIGSSFG